MTQYINSYPGNTCNVNKISVSAGAAYNIEDVFGLVESMIVGDMSSAPLEGALMALEDGSIWSDLCAKHGDVSVQYALEELHELLARL